MTVELPGPHHCIGTARSVTDIIFRTLRARCAANGGALSLKEIDSLYSDLIASFASGFDLFELRHRKCTMASMQAPELPFARDKILSGILRTCGEVAARAACSLQIQQLDKKWIGQLFDGLAQFVLTHVSADFDSSLISAYVETATAPGINVTFAEVLKRKAAHGVLAKCAEAFERTTKSKSMIKEACACVNNEIARQRGITGPHIGKITEDQTCYLLDYLAGQIRDEIAGLTKPSPDVSRPRSDNLRVAE